MNSSIFDLRFRSNAVIQPSADEVRKFFDPRRAGSEVSDLAPYANCLDVVQKFEAGREEHLRSGDFRRAITLGALSHSHLFRPAVLAAIEQFRFYRHKLGEIDLKKPLAFIRSAEEEVARLNPARKDELAKAERLRALIAQRGGDVKNLTGQMRVLSEELINIGLYIGDNLVKIQQLSESSISLLVGLHLTGEKQNQLIEDIKTHFKEQIRGHLQMGKVTKEYVETLKADVASLSDQLSRLILEDVYLLTRVWEQVHEHAKNASARLDEVIGGISESTAGNFESNKELLGRLEQGLLFLATGFTFDLSEGPLMLRETEHDAILFEKRIEMVQHLLGLLAQGRPAGPGIEQDLFSR